MATAIDWHCLVKPESWLHCPHSDESDIAVTILFIKLQKYEN